MLEVAKQQTELYAKFLDKLNRDSTDGLATTRTFVSSDMVSNNEENISLTATIYISNV